MEIITAVERRRRWRPEEKLRVLAELEVQGRLSPKLLIAKLRQDRFGASSERGRKLLDQMELELEELEAAANKAAAQVEAADRDHVSGFTRRRPMRGPLPEHLPRERVVVPSPTACPCCGGRLASWVGASPRPWRSCRGNGR